MGPCAPPNCRVVGGEGRGGEGRGERKERRREREKGGRKRGGGEKKREEKEKGGTGRGEIEEKGGGRGCPMKAGIHGEVLQLSTGSMGRSTNTNSQV